MRNPLLLLLACLFVVMIGFGITLPVLHFYVERLALKEGTSHQSMVMHVTLLTAVYALMQLFFAPLWGRWSDRIGRGPVLLIGLAGYAIAQVLFGLATHALAASTDEGPPRPAGRTARRMMASSPHLITTQD